MSDILKNIMGKIESINPGIKFNEDTDLFETGILDSMSIFNKVLPILEDDYKINVHQLELVPENFETPKKIAEYISRKAQHNETV